ncbi:MAG TPA: sulfur carrier protein ThiS [Mycobacteriales bacterium]|nr:sulfur carrier protein ThiS [Mycobacteriales bacterium]
MKVRINDVEHDLAGGSTLADLARDHIPNSQWVAVVLDGAVVPRSRWAETGISEGSSVEVLTPRQGG